MNPVHCVSSMSTYLVTRWFGTFLYDDSKRIGEKVSSKDQSKMTKRIVSLMDQDILDEERSFLKKKNIVVSEKRLLSLGSFEPDDPFFRSVDVPLESVGMAERDLRDSMITITEERVTAALQLPDFQIIQMVNAVDDLLQTANLLSERLASWNVFPTDDDILNPFNELLQSVKQEISRLESEIQKQILVLAPNICSVIGPILSARMLSCAGSLDKLAKLPSSSIQLLGAEKALFRFKKEGGRPPKHGVIFQHGLINMAPKRFRGRYARVLSARISLAAKADAFTKRDISRELASDLEAAVVEIKKSANV
jgi:nucleolar protein 56